MRNVVHISCNTLRLVAKDVRKKAVKSIKKELKEHLPKLAELEKQRLRTRTAHDLEMIEELGYCSGVENYSRHFDGRAKGEKAFCLLDFFKQDNFMLVIDESHVTLPQMRAMYKGDHSRKMHLVDYGFRLPSAYDNRPLMFEEFEEYINSAIFVSATPGEYEKEHSGQIVEQLVRPTGLVDPQVQVRPSTGQMDALVKDIRERTKKGERTLVTTLTKRMAEDVAEYLSKQGVAVRYMHSEIDGLQRTELIRQMRLVALRKNPSLSASSIETSETSGMSRPSLSRFIPTMTSNSPSLICRISSVRCSPSISECMYLTATPCFERYSATSSAILFVSVVTSVRSPFFVRSLMSFTSASI